MTRLCRDMHWTYEEYLAQPAWFIDDMIMMNSQDAEYSRSLNKK
jgi:hypothetical protein